jgi:hypothetical protein
MKADTVKYIHKCRAAIKLCKIRGRNPFAMIEDPFRFDDGFPEAINPPLVVRYKTMFDEVEDQWATAEVIRAINETAPKN